MAKVTSDHVLTRQDHLRNSVPSLGERTDRAQRAGIAIPSLNINLTGKLGPAGTTAGSVVSGTGIGPHNRWKLIS